MKTELKEVSPTIREIRIHIDGDSLRESYGKVSRKYASYANVPGFRKGYAPLDVVRLRFREEIKSDVLQDVIPGKVADAIREHNLQPLSEPQLHLDNHDNIKVNGSEPLSLQVFVEVMPDIPDPKYKGVEVTRRVKPVLDSEIEELIKERLQREAALLPVEGRVSQVGDTVIADLEGKFEDQPDADPIVAKDLEITLGDEVIEKSFTDNLIGLKEDDEKEFTVVYPADTPSAVLAGKTVHYNAKIKSVGKKEVPELNDEWAQSLDEGYKSLAELRQRLRADLEKLAERDADARLRNSAIAKVIEANPFEVPNTLIENQARNLFNNFIQDLQRHGAVIEQMETEFIKTVYHNLRLRAEQDVRGALLLDKIAQLEKIEVSDAELDEELDRMAEYFRSTRNEIRELIEKKDGEMENIRNNLRTRKSIEAVLAHAKIVAGEWIDESASHAEPTEGEKKPPKKKTPVKKVAKKS